MAFTAKTIWQVETGGDDTNFGGGFDTGVAGFPTDGAATLATSAAPVFTSASYNFVSGDIGAWVYIQSGTNWTPGWYKITAVGSNAATLDAAVGHAVLAAPSTKKPTFPNSVTGCATTASPTGATWGLDYSQNGAAAFSSTHLSIDGTTNTKLTDSDNTIGKNWVGNIIAITSGTGFTPQRVVVVSTSTTTATVDKSLGTLGSTGGVGKLGGALATRGQAGALYVAGNDIYVLTGTYTDSTTTSNVSGGCLTMANGPVATPGRLCGYGTVRGDDTNPPTFNAGTRTSYTMVILGAQTMAENIIVDGNSKTSVVGIDYNASGPTVILRCKAQNCPSGGFLSNAGTSKGTLILCWATNCGSGAFQMGSDTAFGCVARANTSTGFIIGQTNGCCYFCISAGNTGGSTNGFDSSGSGQPVRCFNCVAYGNGQHGFNNKGTGGVGFEPWINCIAEGNTGTGFAMSASAGDTLMLNCAYYNNGTNVGANVGFNSGGILLGGTPFVSASGGNFALNNTTGAGNSCRNAGILGVFPDALSTGYLDIGAVQVGSTGGTGATAMLLGGLITAGATTEIYE